MVPKCMADQTSILYLYCFLSSEKTAKISLSFKPQAKRKKIELEKSKALADTVVEQSEFFLWTCRFQ